METEKIRVLPDAISSGSFTWIPLKNDPLLACLPKDHPLTQQHNFPLTAFQEVDFIELYPGMETDSSEMFLRNHIHPNTRYSTSDNFTAYTMVEAGLGVACTNAIIAGSFGDVLRYLPLDPPQSVEIGIAALPPDSMSPAAHRFIEHALRSTESSGEVSRSVSER